MQQVHLLHGTLELERLALEGTTLTVNGNNVAAEYTDGEWHLKKPLALHVGDTLVVG